MDNKNIFAYNLKNQMEINGKSRNDIAQALKISYFTVSDWVNGKKYPRMDKIEMLANYFGILKSDLIEDKPKEHNEMKIKNDIMTDIVLKMTEDAELFEMVQKLAKLGAEQRQAVNSVMNAFSITEK